MIELIAFLFFFFFCFLLIFFPFSPFFSFFSFLSDRVFKTEKLIKLGLSLIYLTVITAQRINS